MKILICTAFLLVVAMASSDKPHYHEKDAPELFEKFIRDYDRHYESEADRKVHYDAFVESLRQINKFNEDSDSATFDINQFADFTPQEFEKMRGIPRISESSKTS